MAKATIFSDEINRMIESKNLEAAKKLLNHELLEAWKKKQRKKIEIAKKWLHNLQSQNL